MWKQSKNYKIVIGIIIGVILTSSVVYAQAVLSAGKVSYINTNSKLSSTTVQGAIDEIYNNAKGGNIIYHNTNIVGAYLYDSDKCITGDEVTCRKTACPNDTSKNTCPSGTIIKYKVNESTTKTFHVLHDDISTLTLQQDKNTVESTQWYSVDDNTKGPTVALKALENATAGWSNVNTINYTMGTTNFNGTNAYTGCSYSKNTWNCTENKYTLDERSAKSRMITVQEANALGCISAINSCPIWMFNYLNGSTSYGGSTNGVDLCYWLMNVPTNFNTHGVRISYNGEMGISLTSNTKVGVRGVIEINK